MKRKAFTLIELLVVIAIIALLMAILMPALQRVKKQARTVACLSLLKQWALWFSMYTDDHGGYFMKGGQLMKGTTNAKGSNHWFKAMGAYYKRDSDFTCCPEATKPWFNEDGSNNNYAETFLNSTSAWGWNRVAGWLLKGSYGINAWCYNPEAGPHIGNIEYKPEKYFWRTPNVKLAGYVPLFLDERFYYSLPEHFLAPPGFDDQWGNHMRDPCINRHNGFVNSIFLDWSARKVGLKELWTLKWNRSFDISGPWTKAGGVQPSDWPEWMRSFKDY